MTALQNEAALEAVDVVTQAAARRQRGSGCYVNYERDAVTAAAQVLNSVVALTRLASSLHHENGTIAVPGFYECALPPRDDRIVSPLRLNRPFLETLSPHQASPSNGLAHVERSVRRRTCILCQAVL